MGISTFIFDDVYYSTDLGCKVKIIETGHNGQYNDIKVCVVDEPRRKLYHKCDTLEHVCMWHENN